MHKNTLDKFGRSLKSKDFYEHKTRLEAAVAAHAEKIVKEIKDYSAPKKVGSDIDKIKSSLEKLQKEQKNSLEKLQKEYNATKTELNEVKNKSIDSEKLRNQVLSDVNAELTNMVLIVRWYLYKQIIARQSSEAKETNIAKTSRDPGKTWFDSFLEYKEALGPLKPK